MQGGVGVHPAIERLVPCGRRLAPFLSRIAVVIARELALGGELIEVLLIAPNREVAVSRPDLADLQPVVERRLRCIHTDHEEWCLVLPARLARPDRRLARASLHRVHAARSRLIPHAQFYPDQGLDSFLDCLRQSISARGIPTRLYMDNAKIYRSPQLARIAASIGILIIHTPPYQPEGRGKIERFFRSVREQFLADLDPKALLSLEQLNERLWHWLDTVYHRREHSSLQTTPLLRWQRDIARVRQLPPATDLRRLFFHRVDRLVRRDSTFQLNNRFFEAPPPLAGKKIEARFDPLDLTHVEIYCDGKPEGVARLVDAVVNGRTYR